MDDPATLRDQVQKSIVEVITKRLESGAMNEERAKLIAKYVLEMLPENISYEKLIEVIPKLDDNFLELSTIVLPIMMEYEIKVRTKVTEHISNLIKQGKLDDALTLTKQAIEFEKQLT